MMILTLIITFLFNYISATELTETKQSLQSTQSTPLKIQFTPELFLKADRLTYTPEFCRSLQATPFLSAITADAKPEEKSRAFDSLFGACRDEFWSAGLGVNYAVYLLLSGNESHLDKLLMTAKDKPVKLGPDQLENLVTIIFKAPAVSDTRHDRLFALNKPHRVLATLLAYCTVSDLKQLELVRNYIQNHWGHRDETYRDFASVEYGTALLDHYIAHPGDLGARNTDLINRIQNQVQHSGTFFKSWASFLVVGALLVIFVAALIGAHQLGYFIRKTPKRI